VIDFNLALIADLRAHDGRPSSGPFVGRPVLILGSTGARSGEHREAPLVYSRDGDGYVIIASMGGAPMHPAWYFNILADPRVTVEVDGETFATRARVVGESERRRLYDQHAAINPTFREYEAKTSRVIPVIVLEREASAAA
jgi:deazaflavin-dependent oxidoreductase (nitroreductase family)